MMGRWSAVFTGLLLSFSVGAQELPKSEKDYLVDLYKHFHRNPELSYQEKNTAARMAKELRQAGFNVTAGVGGHGVVAMLQRGEGPTVMIRADMDALPMEEKTGLPYASKAWGLSREGERFPIMHACGHDVHMTILVGAARQLAKQDWQGTLMLIGQPAEERGGGAKAMLEDGLYSRFARPDFNLALHVTGYLPAGHLAWVSGYALANVDTVNVRVFGEGGHGAAPHLSKDPIALSAQLVGSWQNIVSREVNPTQPAVISVGSIQGGSKHNIIPDHVDMQLTVRSYDPDVRDQLLAGIKRHAHGVARAFGMSDDKLPEITVGDDFTPSTYNDPVLTAQVARVATTVLGRGQVHKYEPIMGGEDFGRYGMVNPPIPSMMFWLGGADPQKFDPATVVPNHSPYFAPKPEPTIATGVQVMVALAQDLFAKGLRASH